MEVRTRKSNMAGISVLYRRKYQDFSLGRSWGAHGGPGEITSKG